MHGLARAHLTNWIRQYKCQQCGIYHRISIHWLTVYYTYKLSSYINTTTYMTVILIYLYDRDHCSIIDVISSMNWLTVTKLVLLVLIINNIFKRPRTYVQTEPNKNYQKNQIWKKNIPARTINFKIFVLKIIHFRAAKTSNKQKGKENIKKAAQTCRNKKQSVHKMIFIYRINKW